MLIGLVEDELDTRGTIRKSRASFIPNLKTKNSYDNLVDWNRF